MQWWPLLLKYHQRERWPPLIQQSSAVVLNRRYVAPWDAVSKFQGVRLAWPGTERSHLSTLGQRRVQRKGQGWARPTQPHSLRLVSSTVDAWAKLCAAAAQVSGAPRAPRCQAPLTVPGAVQAGWGARPSCSVFIACWGDSGRKMLRTPGLVDRRCTRMRDIQESRDQLSIPSSGNIMVTDRRDPQGRNHWQKSQNSMYGRDGSLPISHISR